MKNALLTLVVVLLLVIGGYVLLTGSNLNGSDLTGNTVKEVASVFILTGENFKYNMGALENPDIIVNEGDLVRIEFTSISGFHDWVVDEFNVSTEKVKDTDEIPTTVVEFVADKKGTFEYYCSVGKHRENGMKGNLIVR